jgi:hypothetical protein
MWFPERRWMRSGGVLNKIEDVAYRILRRYRVRPTAAESEKEMKDPTVTPTPAPVSVAAKISDGTKEVIVVVENFAQVLAALLTATGHATLGNAITIGAEGVQVVAGLAETALEGYDEASSIVITAESISGLMPITTPLAPAADAPPPQPMAVYQHGVGTVLDGVPAGTDSAK